MESAEGGSRDEVLGRLKRTLYKDHSSISDQAHADILAVVNEEGTADEKIAKMEKAAEAAAHAQKRVALDELRAKKGA